MGKVSDKHKFVKRDSFARGFMAQAGVSYRGKTEIRIIDKVKVYSKYYGSAVAQW